MLHNPITPLAVLAHNIVAGLEREPYGRHSLYTPAEWAYAAQCYIDNNGDDPDLAAMVQEEDDYERAMARQHRADHPSGLNCIPTSRGMAA